MHSRALVVSTTYSYATPPYLSPSSFFSSTPSVASSAASCVFVDIPNLSSQSRLCRVDRLVSSTCCYIRTLFSANAACSAADHPALENMSRC